MSQEMALTRWSIFISSAFTTLCLENTHIFELNSAQLPELRDTVVGCLCLQDHLVQLHVLTLEQAPIHGWWLPPAPGHRLCQKSGYIFYGVVVAARADAISHMYDVNRPGV